MVNLEKLQQAVDDVMLGMKTRPVGADERRRLQNVGLGGVIGMFEGFKASMAIILVGHVTGVESLDTSAFWAFGISSLSSFIGAYAEYIPHLYRAYAIGKNMRQNPGGAASETIEGDWTARTEL